VRLYNTFLQNWSMPKIVNVTCKQTALLSSIAEDCHIQHAVNVGGENKEAGVKSPAPYFYTTVKVLT
jgi:serine acetyltransferase